MIYQVIFQGYHTYDIISLILTTVLSSRCYDLHFIDVKSEASDLPKVRQ